MNVWKMLKKSISIVIAIAIVMSLAAPALAAAPLSNGSIGYLAMGDDMSNGIGLEHPEEDTYAVKVAKKLYGENWESSYKLRAGSKYRVEELRYLIDKDYNGDGYTKQFFGAIDTQFERDKKEGTVRKEVANAEYITISAGVNNFSTYIVEQMLYYVENGGKVKYSYDIASVLDTYSYGDTTGADVYEQFENIKNVVKNELMAAAGDSMADAVELVDFVAEVSAYAVLSYIVNFNALIAEIDAINPDAEIYVIGIYNPMAGEKVSVTVNGSTKTVDIGKYFGGLLEIANAYAQILAPRVYDYTYVHPGNPELLIDVMGNSSLSTQERIPDGLAIKLASDANAEATAVQMIQDMFAEYGIDKSYDDAADLAYAILDAKNAEERTEILKEELDALATDVVLDEFKKKLEDNMFGDMIAVQDPNGELIDESKIVVTDKMILDLLADLENEATRSVKAEEFVVDLMTKAMVGKNIDGYVIESQEDAYAAIELLRQNATVDNSDPTALREAAAKMVINKIGKDNILGITEADIVTLLVLMDAEPDETQRKDVVVTWLNDNTVRFITETVQTYVPGYTEADAESLLAQMDASDADDDAAIAKEHLLAHFTPVLADTMEEKYAAGGFELQNYKDDASATGFEKFAMAINTAGNEAAVKELVRDEIRAAAAEKIFDVVTDDAGGWPLWSACKCDGAHDSSNTACSDTNLTIAKVEEILTAMDAADASQKEAVLHKWLVDNRNEGNEPSGAYAEVFFNPMKSAFWSAYTTYNEAATTAEELCADYHSSVNKAADAFGSYAELKGQAADEIYSAYENYYKNIGTTAKDYYDSYVSLRDNAVAKVLEGYDQYEKAMELGMDSLEPLNGVFDKIFELLCEIAEVETIHLNDILAVANKIQNNGSSYINEMVDTLITGGSLAKEDKTVAYLALRYYLADSMMIMPSAGGHQTIANQIIKAIDGEDTSSTGGYYANKVIDEAIDLYHCANAYRDLSVEESGQKETLIDPDLYVALGDNTTSGSALSNASQAYPYLVGEVLRMSADGGENGRIVRNYAINGMRVEELLMLVDDSYNGDEYTADRFGTDYIASLREQYRADLENADLITINVGINNLTTYPLTQTMLAYNGEETYEMDWDRFIGNYYAGKIESGKNAAMDLTLALVDNAESRVPELDGYSAYERCERALNTMFTAIESTLYSYISYIFTLDDAVEQIAALNKDATIALIGLYNPMEETYFQVNRTVTVRGKTIDLSQFKIDTDKLADMMINLVNRYHAHYVGSIDGNGTAADKDSRLLNVTINDTDLFITNNTSISKDLSTMVAKEITIKGKTITVYVPEYFLEMIKTEGEALHPDAAGHQYIANRILEEVDYLLTEEPEEPVQLIKWAGTNTTLGGILELNFALDTAQLNGSTGNYIVLTRTYADGTTDSITIPQDEWTSAGGSYIMVSYSKLAAKEMGDPITGIVYNADGKQISDVRTDSIKTYSMRMLETREDIYTNTYARTLFVDMLNYGAAAQAFFGYDTEHPVNADLDATMQGWATKAYEPVTDTSNPSSGNFYGTSLDLENEIFMMFAFKEAYNADMKAVVTYTDHYGEPVEREAVLSQDGNYVIITIGGIAVADYRTEVTCELYDASGAMIGSVTDTRAKYVARNTNKLVSPDGTVDLGDAIMKFGESAYAYFRSLEK